MTGSTFCGARVLLVTVLLFYGYVCLGQGLAYYMLLSLSADWSFDGVLTVTGTAPERWSELVLRVYQPNYINVSVIEVGCEEQPWWEDDRTTIRIPVSLNRGQTYSLTVAFSGQVPPLHTQSGYGTFAASERVVVLGAAYPMLAAWDDDWLGGPLLPWGDAVVADVAVYRVLVEAPQGWSVVSGGREEALSEGLTMVEGENLRELGIVLLRDHVVQTTVAGDVVLRSFSLPEHTAGGAEALRIAADSVELYEGLFGRYPFSSLDVVAVPLRGAVGVEYPGLILGDVSYYARWEEEPLFFPMIFAHEVAHQWWYAQVGSHQGAEPWVDEALATYSSGLYFETRGRLSEILSYWRNTFHLARGRASAARVDSPLWEFPGGVGYGGIVYSGGALMLHEVRLEMGDEAFFASLRDYLGSHKWGISSGDDLLAALDHRSASALEEIFSRYLSSP